MAKAATESLWNVVTYNLQRFIRLNGRHFWRERKHKRDSRRRQKSNRDLQEIKTMRIELELITLLIFP
jgi:hypothetical protein